MTESDAQVIHALYHSMYRFMIASDTGRLGALLDDSFVLVHMTGRTQRKQEFLSAVGEGTLAYYDEVEQSCHVHVDGERATCIGRSLVDASPFGSRRAMWRLELEISLVRDSGKWLMRRAVASSY